VVVVRFSYIINTISSDTKTKLVNGHPKKMKYAQR